MRQTTILFFLLLLACSGWTQSYEAKNYSWEENPTWQPLPEDELEEDAVVLQDHRIIEFAFSSQEQLVEYKTVHRKIRVNSDQAIEDFNKVFIGLHEVLDLVDIHARTVSPKGVVNELDKSNIKELESVEDYGGFKIFAIEGVEKGADIEYWYTLEKSPSYFGRETFQRSTLTKDASLEIISPEGLVYIAKSYNGFPEVEAETVDEKNYLRASMSRIVQTEEEIYAAFKANQLRVDYKISHNKRVSSREMFTWTDAAQRIFEIVYSSSDKEKKKIAKAIAKLGVADLDSEVERITAIENWVKNNFVIKNTPEENSENLTFILDNKYTTENGFVRLFAACFDAAGIDHELVLTSDRYNQRFDEDFMTWNFLENYLFFFPHAKRFMAPGLPDLRHGLFPYEWSNNDGLFIKQVKIGEIRTALGQVRSIPGFDMTEHYDNMKLQVRFEQNMGLSEVEVQRTYAGFNATFLQPFYHLIPEDERGKLLEEMLRFVGDDAKVQEKSLTNHDLNVSPVESPMVLDAKVKVASVVEKAGKDYLLKIGSLIGPQVAMYQENVRQNPVEIEYPHQYTREINIEVPNGYRVKGLEALDINIEHGNADGNTMGFLSSYELDGSNLQVRIFEYYQNTKYPLTQFNQFREVINAAADFNKIVLVLEKI